ncbi:MAG: hypothetical protein AB9869_19875 [Verrucomicrobiia bacterium]
MKIRIRAVGGLAVLSLLFSMPARVLGIAGLEGTFEFGLDAPWRIEPNKKSGGGLEYGAIPIQITIQDAQHARFDDILYFGLNRIALPPSILTLGKFYSVRVKELDGTDSPAVEFPLNALHEVEVNGDWAFPANPSDFSRPPHTHELCRVWAGEDPERYRDVSQSSEWHATLWYVPRNQQPGTSVALQIEVLLFREPWPPQLEFPLSDLVGASPFITLRNYVRVHLAAEPLPRFDNRWLYGDFHYHSQGTDNEGEAGYNYRGVIRAMGAMGVDFVFATDHASASEQIVDVDLSVDLVEEGLGNLGGWLGLPGGDKGDPLEESDARVPYRGFLRDMDAGKFAHAHGLIYGDKGANREASWRAGGGRFPQNYQSYNVVPQIFLGGELDAIPEVKRSVAGELPPMPPSDAGPFEILEWASQLNDWHPNDLPYGNGLRFDLDHMKDGGVEAVYQLFEPVDDVYLVKDFQGLDNYSLYGREHMVYFPASSALHVGNETTFIPSYTSKYGGATRRLDAPHMDKEALLPEIERKGFAYVAHHLNACGTCSNGPDGVPWTLDHLLMKALRSPAILGLQFWNENGRYHSKVCSHQFCRDDDDYMGEELGYERAENPSIFGYVPDAVNDVGLPLEEFRHGFLVPGGTQGGLFELKPFDVQNGLFQTPSQSTERNLHHGAHDWDMLNLRGLDFEANAGLSWLKTGEPRRVFMGGGSDAHGDLNYRRAGYFLGTEDVNDTAIGKPRNLVFAGPPEGPVIFSQGPVLDPNPASVAPPQDTARRLALLGTGAEPVATIQRRPPIFDPGDPPVLEPPITKPPLDPPIIDPPVLDPPVLDPDPDPIPDPPVKPFPDVTPPIADDPPVLDPGTEPPIVVPPGRPPIGDVGGIGEINIRGHTQEQIIRALRNGRYSVTDGPALRIAIDLNGNKQIDDTDVQMGDFYSFDKRVLRAQLPRRGQTLTLLTEVISTAEFGPIRKVDVYVGVHPGPVPSAPGIIPQTRVYAPERHGVRAIGDPPGARTGFDGGFHDTFHEVLPDGYWEDNRLLAVPPPGSEFRLTAVTELELDSFEAGFGGVLADRFFVRAFAMTSGDPQVQRPDRYAFSNPIWLRRNEPAFEDFGGIPPDVVADPDPNDDPPPTPVSPVITAVRDAEGRLVITFTGTCQFAPSLDAAFEDLPWAVSPYTVPIDRAAGFFRARQ